MDRDHATSPETLLPLLGIAQAPTLIDVCIAEDVAAEPYRLPGAVRCAHQDIGALIAHASTDGLNVIVCQKGLKLSIGAAAVLRARGRKASPLLGGVQGWGQLGLPRITDDAPRARYVFPCPSTPQTLLSHWIIKRWIAPNADCLWVPPEAACAVAERFDASAILPDTPPEMALAQAGLDWPVLSDFVTEASSREWPALLEGTVRQYDGPDSIARAALTIVDAAWSSLRKDIP